MNKRAAIPTGRKVESLATCRLLIQQGKLLEAIVYEYETERLNREKIWKIDCNIKRGNKKISWRGQKNYVEMQMRLWERNNRLGI